MQRWKDGNIPSEKEAIYDYDSAGNRVVLEPEAQIYDRNNRPVARAVSPNATFNIEPHVCLLQNKQKSAKYKTRQEEKGEEDESPLCHLFDRDMHDVVLDVSEISGTKDEEDGKCHYPLLGEFLKTI